MLLPVNNEEYRKAKEKGYPYSYARWAEYCNNLNSESLNKTDLISPKVYFNDIGGLKNASGVIDPMKSADAPALDEEAQKEIAGLGIVKAKIGAGASAPSSSSKISPAMWALILIVSILGITYVYGYFDSKTTTALS